MRRMKMFNEKIIPPLNQLKKDKSDNYWYSPAGASYSPDEIFNHALQLEAELETERRNRNSIYIKYLREQLRQAQAEVVNLKKELLAERRMHLKELFDNDRIDEDAYTEAILELKFLQQALAGDKDVSP